MPQSMQVKLLRVLQEKSFEKVGGNKTIKTNVRIIAATHRDLREEIKKGNFREDLFYRLNVFPIRMPTLRDCIDDIPLLINELLARIEGQQKNTVKLLDEAIAQLGLYDWPGNVRELANIIERLAIMNPNGIVGFDDLPGKFKILSTNMPKNSFVAKNQDLYTSGLDLNEHLQKTEKRILLQALNQASWDIHLVASNLNMDEDELNKKIKKYKLKTGQTVVL